MYVAKWITLLVTLHVAFCQNGDRTYLQTLLNGIAKSNNAQQAGFPNAAMLSLFGSVLQNNQDNLINYVVDTLTTSLDEAAKNYTSSLCLNHTDLFIKALVRRENWALRMIDAMGKPGPGLMDFSFNWAGNFDECVAIQADRYTDPAAKEGLDHPYTGKYCTATVQLADSPSAIGVTMGLNIGMCLPDTCSNEDGSALMRIVTSQLQLNMTLPKMYMSCQEKSLEFTDKALAVTIVGSVFAAIILIATAYDVIIQHVLRRRPKTDKTSCELKAANGVENGAFSHSISKEDLSNGDMKVSEKGKMSNGFTDLGKTKNDALNHKESSYVPGIPGKLILSFSVYSNAPKILSTSQPKGTLTSVNGIRFLSMSWVILGHVYTFGLNLTDNVATYFPQISKRFTFQAIMNASVSVDTFFVLSGLLVSYLSLREMKKRGGALKFNWLLFYFHRFWRLTPPYMLLLMLYVPTIKYWGDGPFWSQTGVEIDECEETWWTNMLYINNLYKPDKQCMGWGWYLANDMQFYVISPLMLVPLYYSPVAGTAVCLVLILVNFISTGITSSHYGYNPNIMFSQDLLKGMHNIYTTPWNRVGPYVVGVFTGYILYKTECKVKMSKRTNMFGWTAATAMAVSVLYGLYTSDGSPPDFSNGVAALYNATSRTAWGLSVAWVIFACATGYGGPVNALLSWPGIMPLSRLTYCAYLVHPLVLYVYNMSRRTMMHLYDLQMIYFFLGHMCVSYAAAFVLSLAFESPMMGLEKVLLGRKKHS